MPVHKQTSIVENNFTVVVKGIAVPNNATASPRTTELPTQPQQEAGPTCPPPVRPNDNNNQSGAIPLNFGELLQNMQEKIIKEVREVKEGQEKTQRQLDSYRRDEQMYHQLQDQHGQLKQKSEENNKRLKTLNKENCEQKKKLIELEKERSTLRQELTDVKERQLIDAEMHAAEIRCKEETIECLTSKIVDLERTIKERTEKCAHLSNTIGELKQNITELEEEKNEIEMGTQKLRDEVEDLKEGRSQSPLRTTRSSTKSGKVNERTPFERELSVHNAMFAAPDNLTRTDSFHTPSQMTDYRRRPLPVPRPYYGTTMPQAFVGTTKLSHNTVHKSSQKSLYRNIFK